MGRESRSDKEFAALDKLIEEITVDAYGDDEQLWAFRQAFEDGVTLPALDPDAEASVIDLSSGIEELKNRLEILLGAKPDAAMDESLKEQVEKEANRLLAEKNRKGRRTAIRSGLCLPW